METSDKQSKNFLADLGKCWPRMVELWIAAVLLEFFLVRILGSGTAKHLLSLIGFRPSE